MNKDTMTAFEFNQQPLSEGLYFITRLIRDDFPEQHVRRELDNLAIKARNLIPANLDADLQLTQLIDLFYHAWGFGAAQGVYNISDTLWLDKVLKTHQGGSATLGFILIYIAQRLGIPLYPVIFPTQLLLRADWLDGESWVINPLNGETLNCHILGRWLKGHLGISTQLSEDDLNDADNRQIIMKILVTLKAALMEEDQPELALKVSQLVLSFDPQDPYEIRDRGLIYAQLDCYHIAIRDLNYFIEMCPEDPAAELIKIQLRNIEESEVTLH